LSPSPILEMKMDSRSLSRNRKIERCYKYALARNATYFGLTDGIECFYDNASTNIKVNGNQLDDSKCYMDCGKKNYEVKKNFVYSKKCGSKTTMSLYQITAGQNKAQFYTNTKKALEVAKRNNQYDTYVYIGKTQILTSQPHS